MLTANLHDDPQPRSAPRCTARWIFNGVQSDCWRICFTHRLKRKQQILSRDLDRDRLMRLRYAQDDSVALLR